MKAASLKDIKEELKRLSKEEVMTLCLKMARHKKDSKELLSYLLFDAHDEAGYIQEVKDELSADFADMNAYTAYTAKKGVQKIQRKLNKYIRNSGNKETKVELLIWFCETLEASSLPIRRSRVLMNLFNRQLTAIHKAVESLHEDLQYDYREQLEALDRAAEKKYRLYY